MSLEIKRAEGSYGQVEAKKVAFKGTREVYAQLPCDEKLDHVENGMLLKYDRGEGTCNTTSADGEWLMVYDEEVLVEFNTPGHHQYAKDFVLKKSNFVNGKIYPRLVGTHVGDHIVTDQVPDGTYDEGEYLTPTVNASDETKGAILSKVSSIDGLTNVWKIDELTTLPDGTKALAITRVK